jgi:hypothetical protein
MASTATIRNKYIEHFRPKWTCAPTSSPGWARPSRSMPSPSCSRKPSGGRSSPMPTSMRRAARPGSSRPIRRPSSAPASKASASRNPPIGCTASSRASSGPQALINRSMWRNFPMIRNKRWVKDNMVLLGDAKATAHFSIGSGTKLAMEDAIALHDAMAKAPTSRPRCTLRARPPRGGREDPAFGRRLAGLVRARRSLLGFRPRAVRLRRDDPRQGDHLR